MDVTRRITAYVGCGSSYYGLETLEPTMNPDELNAKIAVLRGWKPPGHPDTKAYRNKCRMTHSAYDSDWLSPDVAPRRLFRCPPDYAGLWQHCGLLLEEMVAFWDDGVRIWKTRSGKCICYFAHLRTTGSGDSETHAIAAAYAEWKKQEIEDRRGLLVGPSSR